MTYKRYVTVLKQLREGVYLSSELIEGDNRATIEVLWGHRKPTFGEKKSVKEITPILFNKNLNDPQIEAVCHALSANELALIHGEFFIFANNLHF